MNSTTQTKSYINFLQQWLNVSNPELMNITNPYWITFPPPSCFHHQVLAFVYLILLITGSTMNLIVIMTILLSPLRTGKYIMNLSLAASDLLMNMEIPFLIRNSYSCGPVNFTPDECQVYGFVGGLSGTVSISCITMMAYQRYQKISRPFSGISDSDDIISTCKTIILVLCCWGYGLLFATVPIISENIRYTPEGYLTSCSFDYFDHSWVNRSYILSFGVFAYVVPLSLITYFYYKIFEEFTNSSKSLIELQVFNQSKNLKTKDGLMTGVQKKGNREQSNQYLETPRPSSAASVAFSTSSSGSQQIIVKRMKQEKKLIKSLARLVACWFIAWTPYAVISMIGLFHPHIIIHPALSMVPALFAKFSSIANPYIYFLSNPHMRKELIRLFGKRSENWTRDNMMNNLDGSFSRFASIVSWTHAAAAATGGIGYKSDSQ